MQEMHRAMFVGKGLGASVLSLSEHLTCSLAAPPRVHQPRTLLNPVLLGFYGGFSTWVQLIKSLLIGDLTQSSNSSPFPGGHGRWD